MKTNIVFIIGFIVAISSCSDLNEEISYSQLNAELNDQLKVLVDAIPADSVPRSYPEEDGGYRMTKADWTCGFPAGSFWYMYEMSGDEYWREIADENTVKLDGIQFRENTHDLGFMVNNSFGNGYRLTGNEAYKDIVLQASESLMTRYNPSVGAIRSWDHGDWQYPVIIDNMMNLEMLFWTSKETGDPKYRDAAISHADVTLRDHFRDDGSSYHLVSYDTLTGEPVEKRTVQGYSDESAWGRGQAWGLYGFTMTYRETGDEKYLETAENIAGFLLNNLPSDLVTYWDFNDPNIPDAPRDASAAAITASALYELSELSDNGEKYLEAADKIVNTLSSSEYRANDGSNGGFLLRNSVGNKNREDEVSVALNYADYYYLEALKRQSRIKN
ncbi:MAG: glycoside hydrolase family 88 protein [Balneolales bacterium]